MQIIASAWAVPQYTDRLLSVITLSNCCSPESKLVISIDPDVGLREHYDKTVPSTK